MKALLLSLFLLVMVFPLRKFCSVMCNTKGCSDNDQNNCNNACSTNWISSSTTCIPNNNNNYYLADTTANLGGTLTVSPAGTASSDCNNIQSGMELYPSSQTVTVSYAGLSSNFFQLDVYISTISIDAGEKDYWDRSTEYTVSMTDGSTTLTDIQLLTNKVEREFYCFRQSRSEYYNRIHSTFTYNLTDTALTFDISNNNSNLTSSWILREVAIVYRTCHDYCLTCFGPLSTQCYTCNTTSVTYWHSGYTCALTCTAGYGYMSVPNECVLCNLYCSICFDDADNCSACYTYGTYKSVLFQSNNSCLTECPQGYFINTTTNVCDVCNVNCTGCITTANRCTACITSFYYLAYTCYDTCPDKYYLDPNGTNCSACNIYCLHCQDPGYLCTQCVTSGIYVSYLYNTTNNTGSCLRVCPDGYYEETYAGIGPNLCLQCNASCTVCTNTPSPCSQCATGYYLYVDVCMYPCPDGYFSYNYTGTNLCMECATNCVSLEIDMYFPTSLNQQIYVDMTFSQQMDFTTFDYQNFQDITISSTDLQYTLSMFTVTYEVRSNYTYRIVIEPQGYIFLYNATFTVTTKNYSDGVYNYSINERPFNSQNYAKSASLSWFLIKGPPFSDLETNIMESLNTLSTKTNDLLSKPYVQELKKSGVFNLLFSGAQITSCSVLSNQVQSQNLYEGVRFWAIFVFFDVPAYEQISNQTKYFVVPSVEDQIRNAQEVPYQGDVLSQEEYQGTPRRLFSTDAMYWRFQRTGQTSFFIYDCYVPMFLIVLCWILLGISLKCTSKQWYSRYAPKLFSATHKIHQISIMYITMASIVEFLYFESTSGQRVVSAIVCVLFNVYFVCYELYIYYDMMKYPMARIGNRLYDYYVMRYGCFLKNVRFQEYDINEPWSPKHWFRPYNFHFLSYYKKYLMIISLPLFYQAQYAQMGILLFIQLLELIRVCVVWPFLSKKRNILRVTQETALALFFLSNIVQVGLLNQIQDGDINLMGTTISMFYGFGWAGFAFCFYFNVSFVCVGAYDFCVGLRQSNRSKMDNARKKYYYDKIQDYEEGNIAANGQLVGEWLKMGNINKTYFGELPQINVRIEEYTLTSYLDKRQLQVRKITDLRMSQRRNHKKKNNTVTSCKIQKKMPLRQNSDLSRIFAPLIEKYQNHHAEAIVIKTFLNVFQAEFAEGERIPMDRNKMFQRVELVSYDNETQEHQLEKMEDGFPLPAHLLDGL